MTDLILCINLQLFGGGGSSSGLGGGGGGSGEKPFFIPWVDGQGKQHRELIYRKTQEEADKWAKNYKMKNKYVKKIGRPRETTKEKAKAFEDRQ